MTTTIDAAAGRPARWWHQSRWEQTTLTLVVVLGAVLTSWNLGRGGDLSFYASAVRSMSESLPAFLSGSFDPDATVTLDKLAGFAVPQAISVHLFGMSAAAMGLPQVVEGAVTTLAVSVVVLRWLGARAGLVAAALTAATPIFVSMFGHPMEDGLLTAALAVALVWWQRAALTRTWWPLLLAGLFVGIGFQAKMLQAWLVLPALVVGTLVATAGPGPRWRRAAGHLAALVSATLVASLGWSVVVALLPTADHPFVDGSTDDSVFAMVFGYNGVDRFLPGAWPGAVSALRTASDAAADRWSLAVSHAAGHPLLQLFSPRYASQVGWSWPAALAGIVLGAFRWWPRRTVREARVPSATLCTLVVWLATAVVVLSVMHLPHTAYVAGIGVQLAALAALGWWGAARLADAPDRRLRLVPAGLLVLQGAWWTWLARTSAEPALLATVAVGTTAAALVVLAVRSRRSGSAATGRAPGGAGRRTAGALLVAAVVLGPACFSLQALDAARDGDRGDASVGVRQDAATWDAARSRRVSAPGRGGPRRVGQATEDAPFTVSAPDPWGAGQGLPTADAELVRDAERAGGGRDGAPLFLTDSWRVASDVIGATGKEVLTDGGFSGQVAVFSAAQIESMVHSGRERLFLVARDGRAADPVRQATTALGCRVLHRWGPALGQGPSQWDALQSFALERCS
ncbi:glycosyltransferase family 39 protein [Curtobacterium sp. ODYSSEY 48 V2]|uniref:glycosyltransferase family 39 protein n=1 Tax=Curtobacterium sp. ODYSSEY 48 V2 TaxID=2939561 RepID=UPI002042109B|nr:glycosyltransferase family 39 protein [Curtobacterium sp. ODYSSEY 48 V2]MCM3506621.1 glycosyltransferase family 39 protein [Curtobacterium sp. ODYSSEY 48 V2]